MDMVIISHGRRSNRQPSNFSTQTVLPLPVMPSTSSSADSSWSSQEIYLHTPTSTSASSPTDSLSVTSDLVHEPSDPSHYSTTSASSNISPGGSLDVASSSPSITRSTASPGYANSSTAVKCTSSSLLPTAASTTSSVAPGLTSSNINSTRPSNSTSYLIAYNTSLPFSMTHLVYSRNNNSWYCELTHHPASSNFSLSSLEFTLPGYNCTSNSTTAIASSVAPDPISTQSSSKNSSIAVDPKSTALYAAGVTYPAYDSGGVWNMTILNSSHLIYSESNNSIFYTTTGLWYPAGNFSSASLNLTSNFTMESHYSPNYTMPSNATTTSSMPVLPSSTSASLEVPTSTSVTSNSILSSNVAGGLYPTTQTQLKYCHHTTQRVHISILR